MNWAKEAAEAIVDDDAVMAEEDARRRKRNAMLTAGALAGVAGLGTLAYTNRGAISKGINDWMASPPTGGIGNALLHRAANIPAVLGGLYMGASTKTIQKVKGLGPLINKFRGRLGLGSDVGMQGIKDRLANSGAPENKGFTSQRDTGAPLRTFTGGDRGTTEKVNEMLEHYTQNKIHPNTISVKDPITGVMTTQPNPEAGLPVSDLRHAIKVSPDVRQGWLESRQAFEPRQLGAALRHVATSGSHDQLVQNIAMRSSPAPMSVGDARARVLGLGDAMEGHQRMGGRNATLKNVGVATGASLALPWLMSIIRGGLNK